MGLRARAVSAVGSAVGRRRDDPCPLVPLLAQRRLSDGSAAAHTVTPRWLSQETGSMAPGS